MNILFFKTILFFTSYNHFSSNIPVALQRLSLYCVCVCVCMCVCSITSYYIYLHIYSFKFFVRSGSPSDGILTNFRADTCSEIWTHPNKCLYLKFTKIRFSYCITISFLVPMFDCFVYSPNIISAVERSYHWGKLILLSLTPYPPLC